MSTRDARSPRLFLKLGDSPLSLKKYPSQFGGELLFIAANTVSGFTGSPPCGGVAGPSYEQEAPLRPKH